MRTIIGFCRLHGVLSYDIKIDVTIDDGKMRMPRLLMGVALIFWGWMVELPLAGLVMAFVIEAVHWIPWRWSFDAKVHVRAWSLAVILMLITAIFLWLDGVQPKTVRVFLSWMPMFLFPLVFTQCFGRWTTIPLSTFSYFSRRKIQADRRLGLVVKEKEISFSWVYFVVLMVVTAGGDDAESSYYFVGLCALASWAVWSRREKGRGVMPMAVAVLVVLIVATAGQWGISYAREYLMKMGSLRGEQSGDVNWNGTRTRIGHIGQVKQSPEIFWRIKVEQGNPPDLLKVACYNRYLSMGHWNYEPPDGVSQEDDISGVGVIGAADRLADGRVDTSIDKPLYRTTGNLLAGEEARADLLRYELRGSVKDRSSVPLPAKLHTVFASVQDLERNSVGSIRTTPRHAVLKAQVRWGAETDTDGLPFSTGGGGVSADLQLPDTERGHLQAIVKELGLREMKFAKKCQTLKNYFSKNFTYTKDLEIRSFMEQMRQRGQLSLRGGNTPLGQFLREVKAGHCEYFATATTLLLREAGVKARYCVGFSVQEYDEARAEYVLRGVHGHAWCRGWDEEAATWVDLDFTPSSWTAADVVRHDWRRAMADFFLRLREDFTVWRTQPENQNLVFQVLVMIVVAILSWIGYRLWRTKSVAAKRDEKSGYGGETTPLMELEPFLAKYIGQRGEGETLASWLVSSGGILPSGVADEMVHLHQNWRFGMRPVSDVMRRRLKSLCDDARMVLKSRKKPLLKTASSHRGS